MKKILSAVLAAAMVLSMGVMAFATDYGVSTSSPVEINQDDDSKKIEWKNIFVERDGELISKEGVAPGAAEVELEAGDILYVTFLHGGEVPTGSVPENWSVKINNADFVKGAGFSKIEKGDVFNKAGVGTLNQVMVKVELEDDFDHYEEDEVKFYFYIYDRTNKSESERVKVAYDFEGYKTVNLKAVDLDWVVTVKTPTTYKYDKNSKAKKATLDFNEAAFVELKMYPGEKYTVSGVEKYNKALSKEYDVDVETIDLRGIDGGDLVLPASKDNKQVVMVVDGELVAVEAEYVKDYKFESGEETNGYLVENAEEGVYALVDADLELEEVEDEKKPADKDENKDNPAMGANDFVGAAVALAVVSVAAAGALALKK